MPASTVKLFTTGFARSVLGGTARRPTRVVGVGVARLGHGRMDRELGPRGERRPVARAGRGLGSHAVRPGAATGGRRCPQADRPAAAPELERTRQRGLSGGLVLPPPGAHLRPAGRPAHAAREHRLGHGAARRPYRAARAGHRDGAGRHRLAWSASPPAPGAGRRSRLALRTRRRRRLGGDRHHRRARGAAAADRRGGRPAGGAERGLGRRPPRGPGSTGIRRPTSAHRRPAVRRCWRRCRRRRSTRWRARSTAGASTWARSCCSSGPAGATAARRC